MNSWDENGKYILKTLERLEEKLDTRIDNYDKQLDSLELKLSRLDRDLTWHAKIAMAIAAFVGTVLGWLFSRHA
jgi:prefoldin subunit 5